MWWIIIPVIFGLYMFWRLSIVKKEEEEFKTKETQKEERRRHRREELKKEYEMEYLSLLNKFGPCSISIKIGWSDLNTSSYIYVFEEAKIFMVLGKQYHFSDILDFSLVDDMTSETITISKGDEKTSTSNMLGRAVVGGIFTGGIGAVTAAATAKKTIMTNATSQTTNTHKYTIYLTINSLTDPSVIIRLGNDNEKAQKITNVLKVILARDNKQ